jgi:flagellar biosynthesis GTPase FlhF
MNPSRFWGKDIASALRAVRGSLGPDALILETRAVTEQNGGGVEVVALTETVSKEKHAVKDSATAARPDVLSVEGTAVLAAPQMLPTASDDMREELAALRSMLTWLAPGLNHKNRIL